MIFPQQRSQGSSVANQILANALRPQPVRHWTQGLGQMAMVLAGLRMREREKETRKKENLEFADMFFPQGGSAIAGQTQVPAAGGQLAQVPTEGAAPFSLTGEPRQSAQLTSAPQGAPRANLARALLAKYGPQALPFVMKMQGGGGPPKSRTVKRGDTVVTEEWNPQTRTWSVVGEAPRYKPKGTNVFVGTQLPKTSRGKEANYILEADRTLTRLGQINSLYRPEFSTFQGMGKAKWAGLMDRAGITQPDDRKKFLRQYSAWRASQKQYFNAYRKWVTGVAAGPQEMKDIQASIPNVNDSPEQYRAKMAQVIRISQALRARAFDAVKNNKIKPGSPEYKVWAAQNPLTGYMQGTPQGAPQGTPQAAPQQAKPKTRLKYNPSTGQLE